MSIVEAIVTIFAGYSALMGFLVWLLWRAGKDRLYDNDQ